MDTNFCEYATEDGSAEYVIDWDTFSFEGELEARKKILEEQQRAFKSFAESMKPDENYEQVQATEDISDKLQKSLAKNESTLSCWDTVVTEYKKIKEETDNLKAKNYSLEKSIKELEEKETNSLKEYELLKVALSEGIKMYTTCFDIDVTINNLSDTTYEALLRYGRGKDGAPIKFVVDRTAGKVLDFDVSEVLSPAEEEDVRKRFGDLHNLPGLFCALRDIILSKQNNANQ